jgi:uncharacterized protein (UPF0332 family)
MANGLVLTQDALVATPVETVPYTPAMDHRDAASYLSKALESLAGAESELAAGRSNNAANRAYYACFQAAIMVLIGVGFRPDASGRWQHDAVQAHFAGQLINRRHRYPPELRDTFDRLLRLRQTADYKSDLVTADQAQRAVRRARVFVDTVAKTEEL